MSTNYVTQEALDKLRETLAQMKGEGRAKIAEAIAEAREKGDLKENAEYDAAKEAQGMHEAKIAQLESAIAQSRVIDKDNLDLSKVSILSKVTIKNVKNKKSVTYQIVSDAESDLKQKKISVNSPIGQGVLGKKIGDIAEVTTPNGVLQFEIEEISL